MLLCDGAFGAVSPDYRWAHHSWAAMESFCRSDSKDLAKSIHFGYELPHDARRNSAPADLRNRELFRPSVNFFSGCAGKMGENPPEEIR
jgi:hypothetical protein